MSEEKTFFTIELPKTLEKQARLAAAVLGVSKSEIARRALVAFLATLKLPEIRTEDWEKFK